MLTASSSFEEKKKQLSDVFWKLLLEYCLLKHFQKLNGIEWNSMDKCLLTIQFD